MISWQYEPSRSEFVMVGFELHCEVDRSVPLFRRFLLRREWFSITMGACSDCLQRTLSFDVRIGTLMTEQAREVPVQ